MPDPCEEMLYAWLGDLVIIRWIKQFRIPEKSHYLAEQVYAFF